MVAVVNRNNKPLMPTSEYRARKLLRTGRAVIHKYRPYFTIRIVDLEDGAVQSVEYKSDTGYYHVGISICYEANECLSMQADMLADEKEKHNDCRKNRRTRRAKIRYHKPRFDNRKKPEGWLPPSLEHKVENQVYLFNEACKVFPVTSAVFEMGKFDTQLMQAMKEGKPLPEGKDYQHGPKYYQDTLRYTVFYRDHYKCVVCGRGLEEGAYLHEHHVGYWHGDRTDRLGNLATVCEICHTPENHQKGGALYGMKPQSENLASASYMNAVRYELIRKAKEVTPKVEISTTYGAQTKATRKKRAIQKSHANDAYCLGKFFPKRRSRTVHIKKVRRNNRILQKFYDAKHVCNLLNSKPSKIPKNKNEEEIKKMKDLKQTRNFLAESNEETFIILVALRQEGLDTKVYTSLYVTSEPCHSSEDAEKLLRTAICDFMDTEDGRKAYEETCNDFNWLDVGGYIPLEWFRKYHVSEVLTNMILKTPDFKNGAACAYHTVMVNADELFTPSETD